MKRLLLDQGRPRSTIDILARIGWDAMHVSAIGMSRAADADILQRARSDDRICVTLDADFHAIFVVGGEARPSVTRILKEGLDAKALAALLQSTWPGIESALDEGAMVTVTEPSVRVRRLRIARPGAVACIGGKQ